MLPHPHNPLSKIRQRFRSPTVLLLVSAGLSLFLTVGTPILAAGIHTHISIAFGIVLLTLLLVSYAVPFAFALFALFLCFRRHDSSQTGIRVIVLSYVSLIIVFAGLYFFMTFVEDHRYALAHYTHYKNQRQLQLSGALKPLPFPPRNRAFSGIDERLWGIVDDQITLERNDTPEDSRSKYTELPLDQILVFRTETVPSVLSDCLHLSILTITTVGYGNIAPTTWFSKLATEIQALMGTALLVFALGMNLSRTSAVEAEKREGAGKRKSVP